MRVGSSLSPESGARLNQASARFAHSASDRAFPEPGMGWETQGFFGIVVLNAWPFRPRDCSVSINSVKSGAYSGTIEQRFHLRRFSKLFLLLDCSANFGREA